MTENKTKEVIEGVSKQVGQTWTKVQPQLQALLLKLVKSLLPALRNLQTKLTKSDLMAKEGEDASATTSTEKLSSNPTLNKALEIGKVLSSKAIATLIVALTKLQQSLEGESTLDATGEAAGLLNASTEVDSPLVAQVKQEFGIAWKFVKEQVTPKVLSFLQISVDKLDPIATNIWQKVSTKAAATPSLVNSWEKLQENDAWKKTVTATAPIWRSISGIAVQVPLSDEVKRILDKRAGTVALVTLFSLLIILKPSHALSQNVKKVADTPAPLNKPVSTIAKKQPPSVNKDLVKPERGDAPLTSEQIAIAKIQTQVSEVAKQYGESLFGSVQTDFKRGRLVVALNDEWYKLEPSQQTQLVTDLQNRSQSLNFKKLFVADAENHLIARTPVTGNEVVILRQ
ncbi:MULTISPECIES: hypothetical protein [Pseudanabaena]|jgi:hypothetical protein|uniref:hypothetical protein n=1 Tax=Pseudanabaena TaxID=1152 RepID=UPI00247A010A|nr:MULTISPECIES: hypothetical protein [Pseudanabaena]MEA5487241.1 hypothetical protein [Pseudanabaena sp. CCNP1317]WGS70460.1 hypothetical protein OA858_12025 [Pseudanabaena galeata CCNP1313]